MKLNLDNGISINMSFINLNQNQAVVYCEAIPNIIFYCKVTNLILHANKTCSLFAYHFAILIIFIFSRRPINSPRPK